MKKIFLFFSMLLAMGLSSACSSDDDNDDGDILVIYHALDKNGIEATTFSYRDELLLELIVTNKTNKTIKYNDWRELAKGVFLVYNHEGKLFNPILTDDLMMKPVTIEPGKNFCRQLIWPWDLMPLPVGQYTSTCTIDIEKLKEKIHITNFEIK